MCLVCWRLDRLGRNLRHLMLDELRALGIGFVTLGRAMDLTRPSSPEVPESADFVEVRALALLRKLAQGYSPRNSREPR